MRKGRADIVWWWRPRCWNWYWRDRQLVPTLKPTRAFFDSYAFGPLEVRIWKEQTDD